MHGKGFDVAWNMKNWDIGSVYIDAAATGEKIKELMNKNGIKLSELAEKLNVSVQAVSSWRKGFLPSIDNLVILACLFNVSLEDILVIRSTNASKALNVWK